MNQSFLRSDVGKRLGKLVSKLVNEELTDAEKAELVSILESSEEARVYYLRYLDVHSELSVEWGAVNVPGSTAKGLVGPQSTYKSALKRLASWRLAAIVLPFLMIFSAAFLARQGSGETSPGSFVADADTDGIEIATLVRATDFQTGKDGSLAVGQRFPRGLLMLNRGCLQFEFASGATVALQSPAVMRIESESNVKLDSGVVRAYVPPQASGFAVQIPGAEVVDIGTEFSVRVGKEGKSEVDVLRGEVDVTVAADKGETSHTRRLGVNDAVLIDARKHSIDILARTIQRAMRATLPEIEIADPDRLSVPDAYVERVLQADPVAYWRFENQRSGTIRNEVSERYTLKWESDADSEAAKGVNLVNGYVAFGEYQYAQQLGVDEAIESLNEEPFSIELWMRPDSLGHMTCLSLLLDDASDSRKHLCLIEIEGRTLEGLSPGRLRLLYRNPPGFSPEAGENIYSESQCTPGDWLYVVGVKSDNDMKLYLNGELAGQVDLPKTVGDGAYRVLLGRLDNTERKRDFDGSIDEVAIYQSELSAEEIKVRYEALDF